MLTLMGIVLVVLLPTLATPQIVRRNRLVMALEPVKAKWIARDEIIQNARAWMGVPYILGGNSREGVDCSTFVSAVAWANEYYTTDLMHRISRRINIEDLKAGDALNIPEAGEKGHIYLFDRWADETKSMIWVYDSSASCGGVCYRKLPLDREWVAIRYNWVRD